MEERTELVRTGLFNLILFLTIVLANFIIAIISTRKLTPQEFGTYQFLINFSSYFLIFSLTLGWFATRFTARKINIIREVLVYSFLIIILSSLIFLISLYLINEKVINIGYDLIILTLFFMITMQIINVFLGIGYGYNVLISTLGNFLQSIVRLIVLLIIIYLLFAKISIVVILLTFIISNLLVIVYFSFIIQAIKNYKKEGTKFKETVHKLWFFLY
jgi:Polysaccharide biosynthesis protein.